MTTNSHHHLLLNYHDAVIYPSDLEILDSPTAWLNDAIIHFQLTRMQHRQTTELENREDGATSTSTENLFIDPSVISFLMHQLNEHEDYAEYRTEISKLNASWKLPTSSLPSSSNTFDFYCTKLDSEIIVTRRRIFIPICDQFGATHAEFAVPGGGSHWSMLLWEVIARYYPKGYNVQFFSSFSLFDSSSGYNTDAAWRVAKKLHRVLQCSEADGGYDIWMDGDPDELHVVECVVPKQNNGYDCGIFALGFAEAISSASTQQLYPDGKLDRPTKKEVHEAVVRAHFEANGGSEAYASRLRRRIGEDIRTLASSR